MRLRAVGWLILSGVLDAATAIAQEPNSSPSVVAIRLADGERIDVDGRLDEAIWQRASPATHFAQLDPQNGAPATERTEVRVAFDRDRLYLGVECFDSEPARLLGNQMVRDGPLAADDRFMWALDPHFDQRSGYFFEINPSGAMGDGLLVPAGGGGGGGAAASTGLGFGVTQNRAWDGIWLARVDRHERGWTAEIEIPFRTLNFDPEAAAWGANFQRTVRRKNEESLWTGFGRNQGLYNLTSAGRIVGIADASQGVGLDVKPYVIGTHTAAPGSGRPPIFKGTYGGDLLYNVTPLLKSNLTINTDFAQTEVDDRQVNLTRFPLFFPEKRDFFLDGSGSFDFSREPSSDFTAFFSRRVGLDANGRPQKIDYGAKLTGQAGRFDLGVLQVRTAPQAQAPGEDFTVMRSRRRLLRQSYVGLIYTRRSARDTVRPARETMGADFELATSRFRGSQNLLFSGFYARTPGAGSGDARGDNALYGLRINYPNDLWNVRMSYRVVQKNADPAIGFIERADYRRWNPVVRFGPRPRSHRFIRQVSTETWAEWLTDTSNALLGRAFRITLAEVALHSGDTASVTVNPIYERLERNFFIGGITLPVGNTYQYTRYTTNVSTANRRMLSANATVQTGTFYSGHRRDVTASVNLRPRPGVLATLTAQANRVELPDTRFTTRILRALVNTQFGPFVSLANNVQYDSVSGVLGWQVRFRWILTPGNDIYFVTLNNWIDAAGGYRVLDRNTATKIVLTRRF